MSEEKSKVKLVKELTEKVQQLNETETLEDLIKDNKIEFEIDKIKYRVSKPNGFQNKVLRRARNEKFFELLKDPAFKLKEVLIKELKENGVDIIAEEEKIKEIGYTIEDIQNKVAPIPTENKETINNYEKEVKELEKKQIEISIRIADLMEFSIEQELIEFSNLYLIYAILEKEIDDKSIEVKEGDNYIKKWIKAFKTYEEFLNSDNEPLRLEALYYMSLLTFKRNLKK